MCPPPLNLRFAKGRLPEGLKGGVHFLKTMTLLLALKRKGVFAPVGRPAFIGGDFQPPLSLIILMPDRKEGGIPTFVFSW